MQAVEKKNSEREGEGGMGGRSVRIEKGDSSVIPNEIGKNEPLAPRQIER